MKVNVKGTVLEAVIRRENGAEVGYGDVVAVLKALGVPVVLDDQRRPQIALRLFAEALKLDHVYVPAEHTFYIAARPLPPLPPEPVGADRAPWLPVTAPIAGGPGDRRPDLLERIIAQFRVEMNPRYRANRQGKNETYCNIFVWDVTRALGAEIPHWVIGDGEPSSPGVGRELDANAVVRWLRRTGPERGWRRARDWQKAVEAAGQGYPVVAAWENPGGIGHVAILRPGAAASPEQIRIAQAGAVNAEDIPLIRGFGHTDVEFFVSR